MEHYQAVDHVCWDIPVLVEQTLAWLTLKAVYLTLKVNRNPKLYNSVLGAFHPTVRTVRECCVGHLLLASRDHEVPTVPLLYFCRHASSTTTT